MSKVRNMNLADEGIKKIKWVQKHMPVLEHIKKKNLNGQNLLKVLL